MDDSSWKPGDDWTQDYHDPARTGYTSQDPLDYETGHWKLAWLRNLQNDPTEVYRAPSPGVDYPTQAWEGHTVMGGGLIFVPAVDQGLVALRKTDGTTAWRFQTRGRVLATPAFSPGEQAVFVADDQGTIYKLPGKEDSTTTPLAQADLAARVSKALLLMGEKLVVVTDSGDLVGLGARDLRVLWTYQGGARADTTVAASRSGVGIYVTHDLTVHAVELAHGKLLWKVKPFGSAVTGENFQAPLGLTAGGYEFTGGWPVIADQHGIVFVKANIPNWNGQGIPTGPAYSGSWPRDPEAVQRYLEANPRLQSLFALRLDNGEKAWIPPVGNQSIEDSVLTPGSSHGYGYTSVGRVQSMPVIRSGSGLEVAFTAYRSEEGLLDYGSWKEDSRWDGQIGEMMLDGTSVPGWKQGSIRRVDFHRRKGNSTYSFMADESFPLSMAGGTLFFSHQTATESFSLTGNGSGTFSDPLTTIRNPPVMTTARFQNTAWGADNLLTTSEVTYANSRDDNRTYSTPLFFLYGNKFSPAIQRWAQGGQIGLSTDPGADYYNAVSLGLLPRYAYVSGGMLIVQRESGELAAFRVAP